MIIFDLTLSIPLSFQRRGGLILESGALPPLSLHSSLSLLKGRE
jgi:hypothetical protein